jgi:hypothetical protein
VEATGSEPTALLLEEGFLWAAPPERGPVAAELHDLLVAHLEGEVAAGRIDPDRLLAGDRQAHDDYVARQRRWLHSPLPDGRVPVEALVDEEAEEFENTWAAADAAARDRLQAVLDEVGPRPCPTGALTEACADLRRELAGDAEPFPLLRAAAGLSADALPGDDKDLWLATASGLVHCREEPPESDDDLAVATWVLLEQPEWLAIGEAVVLSGPGDHIDAEWLADAVVAGEEDEDEDEEYVADEDLYEEYVANTVLAFELVVRVWQAIGAVDDRGRLTELGWWGIPEALLAAWAPDDASDADDANPL